MVKICFRSGTQPPALALAGTVTVAMPSEGDMAFAAAARVLPGQLQRAISSKDINELELAVSAANRQLSCSHVHFRTVIQCANLGI